MKQIAIEKGILMYYGNRAGYAEGRKVFVDPMFRGNELKKFLEEQKKIREVEWIPGLYDRLANGKKRMQHERALKNVRVWQLKPETDVCKKFIGYEERCRKYDPPTRDEYQCVYDGTMNTNDLEALFEIFNVEQPEGYKGHSLSISDVLELYDEKRSQFFYVDSAGFQELALEEELAGMTQTMQL